MPEFDNVLKGFDSSDKIFIVQNENISLAFNLRAGISMTSIYDKIANNEFLAAPTALFMFSVDKGWDYRSDNSNILGIPGVILDSALVSDDGSVLTIKCHVNDNIPIAFSLVINAASGDMAAVVSTYISNMGTKDMRIKYTNPCISNLTVPGYSEDPSRMLGMIPQEIGGVAALHKGMTLGMAFPDYTTGLSYAMNIMQVACIYDRDGSGGVFFADMGEEHDCDMQPVQLTIKAGEVNGVWMKSRIKPGQTIGAPCLAIGVIHGGNYSTAVDYYVNAHKKNWRSNTVPDWFKEAGAIWSTGAEGSGGPYQVWKFKELSDQITSFDELPVLYDQAAKAVTNLFLLNDYWEGEKAGFPRYWCKGDYIPRESLGGEAALIRGIKGIHDNGGKVIMYLDPLVLYYESALGLENGKNWAALYPDGIYHMILFLYYTMQPTLPAWREHISEVAARLVGKYGADGVYLDSYGWKFNISDLKNSVDNRKYDFEEWNKATYSLVEKIRARIRDVKSDAVVMCESVSGGLWQYADGGFSSDFSKTSAQYENRIIASPVRYGMPQVNIFSNGTTMNHLVQVFAAGHSLALNYKWDEHAGFIKKLLDIRRMYGDALIQGKQKPLDIGNLNAAAYYYMGESQTAIVIVNTHTKACRLEIGLPEIVSGSEWTDVLTGEVFEVGTGCLALEIGGSGSENNGLRILM